MGLGTELKSPIMICGMFLVEFWVIRFLRYLMTCFLVVGSCGR
jgi:hypothetical protein